MSAARAAIPSLGDSCTATSSPICRSATSAGSTSACRAHRSPTTPDAPSLRPPLRQQGGMCGIAGILGPGSRSPGLLSAMAGALSHRGPDDEGLWQDPDAPIGFAHRRLSIVDLTAAGHQPMASADGRWVLSFNGQFYNHRELRAALDRELAHEWRGHNDGETFLEAVARWGLDRAIETAVGMFAIALWDRRERRLHLVRDRFGEKPLYYGRVGGDFIFASE